MEPTIYKLGAYKTPGVYKGAGGIYKGRGVYKDGAGLNDFVEIGGRLYPIVKIRNKYWMTENLDYKFDGISIGVNGVPTTPAAWYYDNNENLYGINGRKFGLLYNFYAALHLKNNGAFPSGWRLPLKDDFLELIDIGGNSGQDLKSIEYWPNGVGTNLTGFNQVPSAYRHDTGGFYEIDRYSVLWSETYRNDDPNSLPLRMTFSTTDCTAWSYFNRTYGYSIRLVNG